LLSSGIQKNDSVEKLMLNHLYGIPVFKTKLSEHRQVQKDFEDVLQEDNHFEQHPNWYCKVDTTFGIPKANELPFQNFIKSSIHHLNEYLVLLGVDAHLSYNVECWLNRYKKDYNQEIHNHAGKSSFSCAYMMNLPKDSGKFVFYRNTYDFFHINEIPRLISDAFQYNNRVTPPLDEGDIVFFPSSLEHYVTPNNSDEVRATISANFIIEERKDG
tara:strand:- start:150 stop:794 length:645 start_codon:yes stop_codon:yes gene_type:complete